MQLKHIKLFEAFDIVQSFDEYGNLRDFINPEHYEEGPEGESEFESTLSAAIWTAETLGLKPTAPDAIRLRELGLLSDVEYAEALPLERVRCVFNSNGQVDGHERYLKALSSKFPELFEWVEEYGSIKMAESASQSQGKSFGDDSYGQRDLFVYQDSAGNLAIDWTSYGWDAVFMLDSTINTN